MTPAEYIRKLRLSKSALKLRDENCKILDVTLDAGFDSVDGYQRAFAKEFGCNPKEFAMNPVPIYLFTPYGVKSVYMKRSSKNLDNLRNIFISVVEKPERKEIIKRGVKATHYFEYVQGVEVPVNYSGEIPETFDIIQLPKSKYLMFQEEPFADEDYA